MKLDHDSMDMLYINNSLKLTQKEVDLSSIQKSGNVKSILFLKKKEKITPKKEMPKEILKRFYPKNNNKRLEKYC